MDNQSNIGLIRELAASEGVFTTAQAARLGIPRDALSYAASHGTLKRVIHGTYRLVGTPPSPYDELAALWKLTASGKLSAERVPHVAWDGIAVGGRTASVILGIGDFQPTPYRIYAPCRINSRRASAAFGIRTIVREDVRFLEGLPVTSPERTIVDLWLDEEDPSLIKDAYRDARKGSFDQARFAELIAESLTKRQAQALAGTLGSDEFNGKGKP